MRRQRFGRRARRFGVALAWIFLSFPGSVAASPIAPPEVGLAGTTVDPQGNRIHDVEVVLVAALTHTPSLHARTGDDGRFALPELEPGYYRVAALKRGYLTFIGTVNTHASHWLRIVLQPAPTEGAAGVPLPRDDAWPLRVARRSVFRDLDSPLGRPVLSDEPQSELGGSDLDVRIEQMFALLSRHPAASGDAGTLQGSETRLRLESPLGDEGGVRLAGGRERQRPPDDTPPRATDSLQMALAYDTGLDSRLAVNAFYDRRDRAWATRQGIAARQLAQAREVWGYDASWTKQIDAASRVDLRLDYRDDRIRIPATAESSQAPGAVAGLPLIEPSLDSAVGKRAVSAVGSYEATPAESHQVAVGVSAQMLQAPATGPTSLAVAPAAQGLSGYSVGIDAQDTWNVATPFALEYGLGYRHAVSDADAALVAPRVGGTFTHPRAIVHFLLSYHAAVGQDRDVGVAPRFDPPQSLGYSVGLELPFSRNARLELSADYAPLQLDVLGYDALGADAGAAPTFVTDGNAAVRRHQLALVHDTAAARTFFEISGGRAEGNLAAFLSSELPFRPLTERDLGFDRLRLGVRAKRSGTQVNLDVHRMIERPTSGAEFSGELSQQTVELGLMQDVGARSDLGAWRLLMALRMRRTVGSESLAAEFAELDDSTTGELCAGVSVLF